MAAQIKQDLNRSGWESTDFPSVCESCLPDNPYVQMLKEDHGKLHWFWPEEFDAHSSLIGAECKLCTRPFTIFHWKADRTARSKRTNICLTCARLKNCCQCCMLDLSYGLPIVVRDAALKMLAPGPESDVNRQYYAQEHERELEEGRGDIEAYEKTDEKARELLRKLANSEPYYKRQRRLEAEDSESQLSHRRSRSPESSDRRLDAPSRPLPFSRPSRGGPSRDVTREARGGSRGGRAFPGTTQLPPQPTDILPPHDYNIMSLFVTGIEDDLPEHAIRTFFTPFGTLRSVVCSHRAHSAFINYATREGAEAAAERCQGKAVIAGVPLRVQWGKPRPLDNMEQNERMEKARQGRDTAKAVMAASGQSLAGHRRASTGRSGAIEASQEADAIAPPPGQEDFRYASLAGN